ncbi:MAG TPA: hypothetical protein VN829_19950, partial [Dongiaceae bacterium]|nr:hypothetical protein [Dongiaceae bacterium]
KDRRWPQGLRFVFSGETQMIRTRDGRLEKNPVPAPPLNPNALAKPLKLSFSSGFVSRLGVGSEPAYG